MIEILTALTGTGMTLGIGIIYKVVKHLIEKKRIHSSCTIDVDTSDAGEDSS